MVLPTEGYLLPHPQTWVLEDFPRPRVSTEEWNPPRRHLPPFFRPQRPQPPFEDEWNLECFFLPKLSLRTRILQDERIVVT